MIQNAYALNHRCPRCKGRIRFVKPIMSKDVTFDLECDRCHLSFARHMVEPLPPEPVPPEPADQ